MEQSRALNALASYLALAKSATSPRAAADLIIQATSAPNTYVFAELLRQPNIHALEGHQQFGGHFELLKCFAWGTWEDFKRMQEVPKLSDVQAAKLRLLSLLTIASEKIPISSTESNLSYASLSARLDLASPIDLEHLVTQAIYSNLLNATLNPANQTVVISSVAPLRDLSPGSMDSMVRELDAWSSRCETVLGDLEAEIARVKADAAKRYAREQKAEKQIKAVTDTGEKVGTGVLGASRGGHNLRAGKKETDDEEEDAMELDANGTMSGGAPGGSKKKTAGSSSGVGGLLGRMAGARNR